MENCIGSPVWFGSALVLVALGRYFIDRCKYIDYNILNKTADR